MNRDDTLAVIAYIVAMQATGVIIGPTEQPTVTRLALFGLMVAVSIIDRLFG